MQNWKGLGGFILGEVSLQQNRQGPGETCSDTQCDAGKTPKAVSDTSPTSSHGEAECKFLLVK